MDIARATRIFAVLSSETRLNILKTLVPEGSTGLSAGALATAVGASPSRASFHLNAMAEAGLVVAQRDARTIRYSVDIGTVGAVMRYFLADCCANDSRIWACCSGQAET